MLNINALKIDIETDGEKFGMNEKFHKNINYIASYSNTQGKSTCIEAIFYCLGIEELLGGQNDKALKPVLRKELEYEDKKYLVLQSDIYLEIENSEKEIVTIRRSVKSNNRSPKLVTVYYGNLEDVHSNKIINFEDMYVHDPGAATNSKGFHNFLEKFVGWELPSVSTYDGKNRKLYLQTIFSAFFVEQKRGWADIMSTISNKYKIKNVNNRVIEFILNLDILKIEKQWQECIEIRKNIKLQWEENIRFIKQTLFDNGYFIKGIPSSPEVKSDDLHKFEILRKIQNNEELSLELYLERCEQDLEKLNQSQEVNVEDNISNFELELVFNSDKFNNIENNLKAERKKLTVEKKELSILTDRLDMVKKDIINNKDVIKLNKLGSTQGLSINKHICPTCHQGIQDSLLLESEKDIFMSIEENIKYLESQKEMLEFAIENQNIKISNMINNISNLESELYTLAKTIRSIKTDIQSNEKNISESFVRKKIQLENDIENINRLKTIIDGKILKLTDLSEQWRKIQATIEKLPKDFFTNEDNKKLESFASYFRQNIIDFRYRSINVENMEDVDISKHKYLPTVEDFDMKFDSSASDNIRAIWAYTIALYQTSTKYNANHLGIMIFDEPAQHSIVSSDMQKFINKISNLEGDYQIFVGITLEDNSILGQEDGNRYKLFYIDKWAIKPIRD